MKFLESLLSSSGQISAVRLMSVFSLLVGAGVAIYGVYMGKDLSGLAQVCAVFVGSAFAAKVGQKFAEKDKE